MSSNTKEDKVFCTQCQTVKLMGVCRCDTPTKPKAKRKKKESSTHGDGRLYG